MKIGSVLITGHIFLGLLSPKERSYRSTFLRQFSKTYLPYNIGMSTCKYPRAFESILFNSKNAVEMCFWLKCSNFFWHSNIFTDYIKKEELWSPGKFFWRCQTPDVGILRFFEVFLKECPAHTTLSKKIADHYNSLRSLRFWM